MTLDELKMEVYLSLKINDERLDTEALKNQELYAKYLDHKSRFELLLHKAKGDYKKMYREKWEYYSGKSDPQVYILKPFNLKILRTDVDKYINADEVVQKATQKVEYLKVVVDFLDRTLRQITNRTFTIKNAIDWKRFTSGAV